MDWMCLDFINSQWYGTHEPWRDGIKDALWRHNFLHRWAPQLTRPLKPGEVAALLELREIFLPALDAMAGNQALPLASLKAINAFLARFPLVYHLQQDETGICQGELKPEGEDFDQLLLALGVSLIQLIEAEPARVKRCQNPGCGWAFWDDSKNNTRKWCGNTCASLMKVRRFRQRHKTDEDP